MLKILGLRTLFQWININTCVEEKKKNPCNIIIHSRTRTSLLSSYKSFISTEHETFFVFICARYKIGLDRGIEQIKRDSSVGRWSKLNGSIDAICVIGIYIVCVVHVCVAPIRIDSVDFVWEYAYREGGTRHVYVVM